MQNRDKNVALQVLLTLSSFLKRVDCLQHRRIVVRALGKSLT